MITFKEFIVEGPVNAATTAILNHDKIKTDNMSPSELQHHKNRRTSLLKSRQKALSHYK